MRVVACAGAIARETPERFRPHYLFSVAQARANVEVISRFGRFPHRNPVLGRTSAPEEEVYIAKGDFVHTQEPPWRRASA